MVCALLEVTPRCASAAEARTDRAPGISGNYVWQQWTRDHGLPDNRVDAVIQTREGHVWAATPTGLARFDGRHWEVFHMAAVPGLLTNRLSEIAADAELGLWLIVDYDLVRWNGHAFVPQALGERDELARTLCAGSDGGVWVTSLLKSPGLWRVRDGARQFRPWARSLSINSLLEEQGSLWIGDGCGIMRLDIQTGKFEDVRRDPDNGCRHATKLEFDSRGTLWVMNCPPRYHCWLGPHESSTGATNKDLHVYNDARPIFLFRDRHGQLWFPDGKGRIAFIRDGQRFDVSLPTAAADDVALSMTEDFDGGLWVATEKSGLLRLRPSRVRALSVAEGLPNPAVWALLEARDGSVWIGTDGGVTRWQEGRFSHWTERDGLSRNAVRALAEDADGRIWIGTGSGLNWIEQGRVHCHHLPGQWFNSKIRVVLAGRDRTVWLGTARGLHRVQLLDNSGYHAPEGSIPVSAPSLPFIITAIPGPTNNAQSADVLALLEDRAGTLWAGTSARGLCRVEDGQLRAVTMAGDFAPHFVWALHEDEAGALWLGTERGLARLKDQRGFAFGPKHGLPDDFVNHVAQDDRGNLWLAGERGIYRLNKRDLDDVAEGQKSSADCVAYDEDDGLPAGETNGRKNQPGILRTQDGRLWFATARGVVIFDPRELPDQTYPPPVVLTRVLAAGQTVFDNSPGQPVPTGTNLATIDPRNLTAALPRGAGRVLEIHYTASTFVAADKLRFQHRLEGLDRDWTDAGMRRVAQYANLKPGNYRFQVRAINKYGVWNETGAAFAFTIAPFFWQTAWFKASALITPLVAGVVIYRRRFLQHRRRAEAERLAAVAGERADIARDLHDHLGARLTLVQHLSQKLAPSGHDSELARRQLAELAGQLNTSLDGAVWAVQPDKDTLASLADYLGDSFQQSLAVTDLELELEFPERFPAWSLARAERYHLALVAVEALNNIVKHAAATLVRLRIEVQGNACKLFITDNGHGIDPAAAGSTPRRDAGNGLANMRHRMLQLGGGLEIASQPGRGTTIILTLVPAALRADRASKQSSSKEEPQL